VGWKYRSESTTYVKTGEADLTRIKLNANNTGCHGNDKLVAQTLLPSAE